MKVELEVVEMLTALGPIQDKALECSRLAAISTGDEHEIFDMTSRILNRVAARLTTALYPDLEAVSSIDEMKRQLLEDEIEFGIA